MKQDLQPATSEDYWRFVRERHEIYVRRRNGVAQDRWTDDPILKEWKFTNIYRRLDRTTIWLVDHYLDKIKISSPELIVFHSIMFRLINYWPAMEEIGLLKDFNKRNRERFVRILKKRKAKGLRNFTNAYMLHGQAGKDKIDSTHNFLKEAWDRRFEVWLSSMIIDEDTTTTAPSCQKMFKCLCSLPGVGPFIAYEIVTDLTYTPILSGAFDKNTWAHAGPGAHRGIERMKLGGSFKNEQSNLECMIWLYNMSFQETPDYFPAFTLRDVEHSLCEFDKYQRVKTGAGTPRMRFVPYTEGNQK